MGWALDMVTLTALCTDVPKKSVSAPGTRLQTAPLSAMCAFYLRFVQYSQAGQWRDTRDTGHACHIVRGHVTSRDPFWRDSSSSPRGLETCGGWVLGAGLGAGSRPQSWRGHASGDLSLGAALARTPHHRHGGQDIQVRRQKR